MKMCVCHISLQNLNKCILFMCIKIQIIAVLIDYKFINEFSKCLMLHYRHYSLSFFKVISTMCAKKSYII